VVARYRGMYGGCGCETVVAVRERAGAHSLRTPLTTISATPARHKTAIRTSRANLATSSFFLSRAQYSLTVFKEISSFAAISAVFLPTPSSRRTSLSRRLGVDLA